MFDAIVLAGGRAARLDGADKPALEIGGQTLLARVVSAVREAQRIVVVGPQRDDVHGVTWCREEPPGGGPVAGIAAGLAHVTAGQVLVAATDLPWIADAVQPLLAALGEADAAVLVDDTGRRNYLAAAWRSAALRTRIETLGEPSGASARSLYEGIDTVEVDDPQGWGADCDTWADVQRARERAQTGETG